MLKVILWKHYAKNGLYPIKIRVTINRQSAYYQLPVNIEAKYFRDKFGEWVHSSRPNALDLNIKIKHAYFKLESFVLKNPTLNAKEVIDLVDKPSESFYYFFDKKIEYAKTSHSFGFYKRIEAVKSKLENYAPKLELHEFNVDFIRKYESHLIELGNATNTIASNFAVIKAVANELVKEKKIEYGDNPFLNYKLKKVDVKRFRLSAEEIDKIKEAVLMKDSLLWHVRNAWLFSFYCGGIRFSDLAKLEWSFIANGRLNYKMNKNKTHRSITLISPAKDILNLYNGEKYIFKILKDEKGLEVFRRISTMNTIYNEALKSIAAIAEVPKFSFHTSRHSFADWAIKNGVDIYTLKGLLGHSKVSTTELYAQSFYQEEADKALEKMFG